MWKQNIIDINWQKRFRIEGIKYYGSKEYKTYVSWNDTYFDIIGCEIVDKEP